MAIDYEKLFEKSESAFLPDTLDQIDWLGLVGYSERLTALEELEQEVYGRSIQRDCFFALSGIEQNQSDPMRGIWKKVTEQVWYSDLAEVFSQGRTERVNAVAALSVSVKEMLDQQTEEEEPEPEHPEPQAQPAQSGDGNDGDPEEGGEDGDGAGEQLDCSMPVPSVDPEAIKEQSEAQDGLGRSMSGTPSERLEKARLLMPKVNYRVLAKALGWAKQVASGASRSGVQPTGELAGYRPANWSDNVRPDEMLSLAQGRPDAMARMADGALATRKTKNDRAMGRGPLIILRDESGSMQGPRHEQALSFEIALADVMRGQNREVIGITWSHLVGSTHEYGKDPLERVLSAFMGGGTNLGPALRQGFEVALDWYDGADILVITDGDVGPNPIMDPRTVEMMAEYRDNGGRVWAIGVGDEAGGNWSWADGAAMVDQLMSGDAAKVVRAMMSSGKKSKKV